MDKYNDAYGKFDAEEFLPGKPSVESDRAMQKMYEAHKVEIGDLRSEIEAYKKAYQAALADQKQLRATIAKYTTLLGQAFCQHCREDLLKWYQGIGDKPGCIGCRIGKTFKRLTQLKKAER